MISAIETHTDPDNGLFFTPSTDGRISMSFFGKILDKLGISQAEAAPAAGQQKPAAAQPDATAATPPEAAAPAVPAPTAVSVVDVRAHLEELAAANPQKLNWKTSIVDLLKLLDLDSSYAARKELATELACPAEFMSDSAQMNMWLHKTVLKKIADNGGNIPADLLD
ncbi:MAG: DUF3597 domain-containing protein [Chromatiaceae bacterium]